MIVFNGASGLLSAKENYYYYQLRTRCIPKNIKIAKSKLLVNMFYDCQYI